MSQHTALVVPVKLEPHTNSDTLSIVKVGGYSVCVKSSDWLNRDRGIYIIPESIVDCSKPEFSFLGNGKQRIKVKRLRGVYSQGFLIPCPNDYEIGRDCWDELGLTWHEQEQDICLGGDFCKSPDNWQNMTKYDIENLRSPKVLSEFVSDEMVYVSRKLNGSNIGVVYSNNEMYVRSRSGFRTKADNIFWNCLTPEIEEFCKGHPDTMLYGEVIGGVKNFKYDCDGKVSFRCFDILREDRSFLNYSEFIATCNMFNLTTVPIVGTIPFQFEKLVKIAEEPCPLGNAISEGIVLKPIKERWSHNIGRVAAKVVSNQYLEKS